MTTYYNFVKSVLPVYLLYVKETVKLREEAVRYHDQTGGKLSRFESVTRISEKVQNETS
jgi:hypothetical protein